MILKKPYAFLIRHFRLIHLILAIPLIYVLYKTHLVVNFFNQYVSNSYTFQTGSDISGLYITGSMLLSIFVIVVSITAIYYLLKYKEKPVKMYVVMMIFYILLFIMLFWYSNIISSMSKEVLSAKLARLYRDISIIIYIPQYIFVGFSLLRAVGFNIKQFNFKHDLKELEITSEDNEEVEVGFEIDGYKTKRFFRRFKREFSYYLIENKLMVSAVLIILMFTSIIVYYNTRKSYNTTYSQGSTFNYQGFSVNVKDSIITNLNYKGEKIDDKYYYLVLKTNIINLMDQKEKLSYDSFIIKINGENYIPIPDKSTYFLDYGAPYYGDYIKPNIDQDYALVYQIKKSDLKKSYKLKLLSSFEVKKNDLVTNYAIVNLTPVQIEDVSTISTVELKNKISFSNTNVGNTLLTFNDFERTTSYFYDYDICYTNGSCSTKKGIVGIDYTKSGSSASLLAISYDFDLDDSTSYAKYTKNKNNFFTDFVTVRAVTNNVENVYKVTNVTPKELTDKVVLQVDGNIINSEELDLYITVRNKRYIVKLI